VTFGLSVGESGILAPYDGPLASAMELAVSQINGAGGFTVAGKKYTIKLETENNQSDQQQTTSGILSLVRDDKAKFIFGPAGPYAGSSVPITQPAKVIQFTAASSVAAQAGATNARYLFTTLPSTQLLDSSLVKAVQQFAPSTKRVAIFAPNDGTAAEDAPGITSAFGSASGYSVKSFLYPPGTADLSSTIASMAAYKPDLVILGWVAQDVTTAMKQLGTAQLSKSVTLLGYGQSAELASNGGGRPYIADLLTGVDLTSAAAPADVQAFNKAYLSFTKASALPAQYQSVLQVYDFPRMLIAAMQQANSVTDTDAIANALRSVKYTGLGGGTLTYNAHNQLQTGTVFTFVPASGSAQTTVITGTSS
jgi:ABC-type branched-subunit amino acid transport system substrate-binding protein